MISDLILPIICKKYNISCILFDNDFKIIEFTSNLKEFANDSKFLDVNLDIRESFWGLVGIEDKLDEVAKGKKEYLHIPMLSNKNIFYDINIETCTVKSGEKYFIAIITKQSKVSMSYLYNIQQINHENLNYEDTKKEVKNKQEYFNLINNKLISFHINDKGIITEVNKACSAFFNLSKKEMKGYHFSKFFFSREAKKSLTKISNILRAKNSNNVDVFFHTDIIPNSSTKDASSIIICQDITYLKKIESELEYAVNHDSLTGLPNRLMLRKKIEDAISKNKDNKESFALCFIDLNKFKRVNDEYGHNIGDILLKHVGTVLTNVIREGDVVARIGGDEFVILIEHIETEECIDLTLKRIEKASKNNPLHYSENLSIDLSFSIGVSVYPKDGEDIETLLQHADEKMYKEKKRS